jgi:N utilization substance protein A
MDLDGEVKRDAAALFSSDEAQEIDRIMELPGVPERIAAALAEQGIERIEDLVEMSDEQLAGTRGLTSEDISTIRNLLDETVEIVEEDEDTVRDISLNDDIEADVPGVKDNPDEAPLTDQLEEVSSVSELGFEQRVTDALATADVHAVEDLISKSDSELSAIAGLSEEDVKVIRQLLDESVEIIEEPSTDGM